MSGGGYPTYGFLVCINDFYFETMAYTNFTLYDLRSNFGIRDRVQSLFRDVEAKRDDLELGVVQCAAQMVGIQRFNEKYGESVETIYGCATTADTWQFLCLTGQELLIDHDKYFISELEAVLGVFQQIIDYYKEVLVE